MYFKFIGNTPIIPLIAWVVIAGSALSVQAQTDSPQQETEDIQQSNDPGEEKGDNESKWGKFLPLPIFITEPAIGENLGGSLIYFHREKQDDGLKVTTGRKISNSGRRR